MDIKTLQMFEHLAGTLHFGRSATALHVTPSTLSRSIQRLEEHCGCVLFQRNNRQVRLTAAGELVLNVARQTLLQWGNLQAELRHHSQQLRGELSLFCSVTASYSHLPGMLAALRGQYPNVEIKLITGEPGLAFEQVANQGVDMAVAVVDDSLPGNMDHRPLDILPLGLIAPLSVKPGSLADIDWRTQPVIMPESGPSVALVENWFRQRGIKPKVYAHVGGHEAIVSMVALGLGIGFVPKVVIDYSVAGHRVSYLPVEDMPAFRLGLIFKRDRRNEPLIAALCEASF